MPFMTDNMFNNVTADEFAQHYLQALGAKVEQHSAHLVRAELTRDQLCTLENRPSNTWFIMNNMPELTTLYLTSQPEEIRDETHWESVQAGSWRFRQMCESAWRIGHMTRVRVTPKTQTAQMYRPFIIFGFEMAFICTQRRTSFVPIAIDLTTGHGGKRAAHALLAQQIDEQIVPASFVIKRTLRYKHAFEIACEHIKDMLRNDETTWSWYYPASYRYQTEREEVEQYWRYHSTDEDDDERHETQRNIMLQELSRRCKPRIKVRTQVGMIALVPDDVNAML